MILADTSIWIDHFRRPDETLARLIQQNQLLMHPFVIGELAMGSLAQRQRTLGLLGHLPTLLSARHIDVLGLVEARGLFGIEIGWSDANLLCAAKMRPGTSLWTRDRRLHRAAEIIGVAAMV